MNAPVGWLLEGEPWLHYRTRLDLLGQAEDEPGLASARIAMLADTQVQALVVELGGWPGQPIASHKSAGQSFHKLTFLADLGLRANDPGMDAVCARILARQSSEGPFQLPVAISPRHGGTGEEIFAWALCDAPLIVYALACFGLADDPVVQAASRHLVDLVRTNGWPCAVSKELAPFRGPGRKDDPCPFANLAMLKALSALPTLSNCDAAHIGVETLLSLWSESMSRHPYIFYMGTDFRKLKVPFIWYDLMHVLDILSRFPWLRTDSRMLDMYETMQRKADADGLYSLESVWTAWKDWEFGQKKTPSRWLTLMAWRITQRIEGCAVT